MVEEGACEKGEEKLRQKRGRREWKGEKERREEREEGREGGGREEERKEGGREGRRGKAIIVHLRSIHFGATSRVPGSQHKQQSKCVKPPPQEGSVSTGTPLPQAVPIGHPQGQGQPLAGSAPPAAGACAALIAVDNCADVDHNFPALSPHLGKRVQLPNETPGDKQQAEERAQPTGKLLLGSAHTRQMDQRDEMGARMESKACLFGDVEKSSLRFIF